MLPVDAGDYQKDEDHDPKRIFDKDVHDEFHQTNNPDPEENDDEQDDDPDD